LVFGLSHRPTPDDYVQRFQLENKVAQGRLVRLGDTINKILKTKDYPHEVAVLLGEIQVIAGLMAGILKFKGVLSIQIKSDGVVTMLMVDVTNEGAMRGLAKFDSEKLEELSKELSRGPQNSVSKFLGNGYFVLSVDQGPGSDPYQGVIELEGATLSECAQKYLSQSAQIDAVLKVVVLKSQGKGGSNWRGGGLMLQKLASTGLQSMSGESAKPELEDCWRRAVIFLGSCTNEELLDSELHPHDILYRLFSEDGVRVFSTSSLFMKCRCSMDKIKNLLASFPREEVENMKINGEVSVNCEFCNVEYIFSEDHIAALYKESSYS